MFKRNSIFDIRSKPYTLLGIVGFFVAIISFIPIISDSALDINLHDTYFVITDFSLYRFYAVILLFLWSVYLIANRLIFSRKLTWLHIIATLLPIVFFIITKKHTWGMSGVPRRYYALSEFDRPYYDIGIYYVAIILSLVIGQLIFLTNLIVGTIKHFQLKNHENKN